MANYANLNRLNCPLSYSVYKFQPETGQFSACCDAKGYDFDKNLFDQLGSRYFLEHPRLIERKTALKANIRHKDCNACWDKEDAGWESLRVNSAKDYGPEWLKADVDQASVQRIELWMQSTCNLGCFMCHSGNSNTLRQIYKDDPDVRGIYGNGLQRWLDTKQYTDDHKNRFISYIKDFVMDSITFGHPHTITLAYLGGEPTLHDEMYDHADDFIAASKLCKTDKKFQIEIVTNGTSKPKLTERVMTMFRKYKAAGWKTRIMLSQDSVDKMANVRYGADFRQIADNYQFWISSQDIDTMVSFTVLSNLNLPYIDQMAEYQFDSITKNMSKDRQVIVNFNTLVEPNWMRVDYLPKKYADTAISKAKAIYRELQSRYPINVIVNWGIFNSVTKTLPDSLTAEQVKEYFTKLEYVGKIYKKHDNTWDFFETFPHLQELSKEYMIKI